MARAVQARLSAITMRAVWSVACLVIVSWGRPGCSKRMSGGVIAACLQGRSFVGCATQRCLHESFSRASVWVVARSE